MEMFIFRREEYERLYNCSLYDVEQIPLERRQHSVAGFAILLLCAIFCIIYLPPMFVMRRYMDRASYKIMFFIGLMDVGMLAIVAAAYGVLTIRGSVFCSDPDWVYVHGALSMAFWKASSECSVLLALNRCLEMSKPSVAALLFDGRRTFFWLGLSSVHYLWGLFYATPLVWTSLYVTMVFNPHAGYLDVDESEYIGSAHSHQLHNTVIFVSIVGLYTLFGATLSFRRRFSRPAASTEKDEWKAFLQISLIALCTASAAGMYVMIPVLPDWLRSSPVFIHFGTFAWIFSHGIPAVIYLTMNPSMRNDMRHMFAWKSASVTAPTTAVMDATVVVKH
ncbi:Protein SRT-42 b [Aphelenchoides avenae]|nr:Protein SRT-42 b [Aphelenchus avenae]